MRLKKFVFTFLLVVFGLNAAGSVFQFAQAASANKCEAIFISDSETRSKTEIESKGVENRDLDKAEEYLNGIVQSGQPFAFDQAIEYVLLSLPDGAVKETFAASLQKNILDQNLSVSERSALGRFLGANRVAYYSRLLHPLRDQAEMAKKIYWNSRVVKTASEALSQVFEAVRIVLEPEFKPIRTMSVYFGGSRSNTREFIDTAQKMFVFQYEVYKSTQQFADVSVSESSSVKTNLGKLKRIFLNFLWLKQYRTVRELNLSQDVVSAMDAQDPLAVKVLIRKKYGAEVLVHWYIQHLKNVQSAAIISLAAVLAPPLVGAVEHQYNLESLQMTPMEVSSLKSAATILSGATAEAALLLQKSVENSSRNNLQPAETQFLNEVQGLISKGNTP
jgi:hypothetical protein